MNTVLVKDHLDHHMWWLQLGAPQPECTARVAEQRVHLRQAPASSPVKAVPAVSPCPVVVETRLLSRAELEMCRDHEPTATARPEKQG